MAILGASGRVKSLEGKETVSYKVFNDVTTDETKSDAIDTLDNNSVTLVVETGAGVSSGVVKLEGAMASDYAGTWVELGSITTNAASAMFKASVLEHPLPYMRARVETVIGGGTLDAWIIVRS